MDVVHDDVIDRVITHALGEVLKRTREDLGLSQAQLVARMPSNVRVKTLASYEQGARACTVVRLCEIARALGASPVDILARALHRAEFDAQTVRLHVDLRALTDDTRPELKQLRRWARARLATYPKTTLARLDGSAIQEMAVLLETTLTDLVSQLAMFTPNTAS
ncbi:MAG: helix-turn-helix transcriptional regulator [Actinophytocola sp.]|uniref:helix-turn-helix domain-containing protein n=1 Tax=Actinophytocola sp. TaxID=1872138 RepID=UPI003C768D99